MKLVRCVCDCVWIPAYSNGRKYLSVWDFSVHWTEFLSMEGIYKNGRNLQKNRRNFWDSAGKFRKSTWTEISGKRTEIGEKRTELSGKWTELPGTPKSAKGPVVSEVDGKNMNGRNFLQTLSGQKFVSIEVPGIFCFAQFWKCWVQNIHRSFVGWTDVELSGPQLPFVIHGASASAPSYHWKPTAARRVSGKTAWGETPLHMAAFFGRVAAAELLLSKGAAVDAKNKDGLGLNPGSVRQTSSLELGALQNPTNMFRAWNSCVFSKCLAKSWLCTPNVGISDHK